MIPEGAREPRKAPQSRFAQNSPGGQLVLVEERFHLLAPLVEKLVILRAGRAAAHQAGCGAERFLAGAVNARRGGLGEPAGAERGGELLRQAPRARQPGRGGVFCARGQQRQSGGRFAPKKVPGETPEHLIIPRRGKFPFQRGRETVQSLELRRAKLPLCQAEQGAETFERDTDAVDPGRAGLAPGGRKTQL